MFSKKSKVRLAIVFSLFLTLSLVLTQSPVRANSAYTGQEKIIMDVLGVDTLSGVDYQLVGVAEGQITSGAKTFGTARGENLAVRLDETLPGGFLKSTFYIPFTETENGTLQNTFAYSAVYGDNAKTVSNITVKIVGYAGKFVRNPNAAVPLYCFKPYSAQASWTAVGSGTITRFTPIISVAGIKHHYNNSTQTMGSAIAGNQGEITNTSTRKTYSSPERSSQYTSGAMCSESSSYAFEITSFDMEIAAACEFTYRTSSGSTGSSTVSVQVVDHSMT